MLETKSAKNTPHVADHNRYDLIEFIANVYPLVHNKTELEDSTWCIMLETCGVTNVKGVCKDDSNATITGVFDTHPKITLSMQLRKQTKGYVVINHFFS